MTTDADERPTDDTAPEAPAGEAAAEVVAEPGEPAAEASEPAAEASAEPAAEASSSRRPRRTRNRPPRRTLSQPPRHPQNRQPRRLQTPQPRRAQATRRPSPPRRSPREQAEASPKKAAKKPRRRKPRERRKAPELPKTRAPLPLDELRDASRSTMNLFGPRQALRDALGVLAPRERQELNVLIAGDEDHRPRARNIANGSIGAGRIDKAMAATIVSMAPQEELWSVLLDKEQAAQKLGRIRQAKQRDKQRADRAAERANRADRVSREDMEKATDGSVGATIRFVTGDEKRERREKDAPAKKSSDSVLDRLGY